MRDDFHPSRCAGWALAAPRLALAAPLALLWAALVGCARPLPPDRPANVHKVKELRAEFQYVSTVAAQTAGPVGDPTGWATLKGVFKFGGAAPARAGLNVTGSDNCDRGAQDEAVMVGANGELKNVVVWLRTALPAGDAKWEHPDHAAQANATIEFDQKKCVFLTHVASMRKTQTLKILNSDAFPHNTKIDPKDEAQPINSTIGPQGAIDYKPGGAEQAPMPVACSIHPWMSAWLMVSDSPYHAVSKDDGSFEIANIPAGVELEFRVWQEKAKYVEKVKLNDQDVNWPKGVWKVKLEPGETRQVNVVVAADALK